MFANIIVYYSNYCCYGFGYHLGLILGDFGFRLVLILGGFDCHFVLLLDGFGYFRLHYYFGFGLLIGFFLDSLDRSLDRDLDSCGYFFVVSFLFLVSFVHSAGLWLAFGWLAVLVFYSSVVF